MPAPMGASPYNLAAIVLAQAAASPHRDAIRDSTRTYSYLELANWSAAIGEELARRGIREGSRVAIRLERSAAAVAALLAILRVGAAYVPLSATAPAARSALVLADSKAALLLTNAGTMSAMGHPVPSLDVPGFDPAYRAAAPFECVDVDPSDTAWILYTSGSTGRPKGVLGSHRGSRVRIDALWELQPFEEGEVAFQHTAFTTVDSFWEIFGPLGRGSALHIVDDETVQDVQRLVPLLGELGVRRITLVPSLLNLIVDLFPDLHRVAPSLVLWVASGEPLDQGTARRFLAAAPHARLFNQYGMTETCADVTSYEVPRDRHDEVPGSQYLPIGWPFPGTRLAVIDSAGKEMGPGRTGELVVRGEALCEGYVGLPELTSQRFHTGEQGERTLRTGDLAIQLDNGSFAVLGRIDGQINLRGFRVEPGEIEAILRLHPLVSQAAACVHEVAGQRHLVAHVALAASDMEERGASASLAEHAARHLLPHMLPSSYVFHATLPSTPSGKIDRSALSWRPAAALDSPVGRAPANAAERILLESIAAVAAPGSYGVHSTLVDAGLDSLGIMRLAARLRASFEGDFALRTLFEGGTVEKLARALSSSRGTSRPLAVRPEASPTAPMAHAQERLWFLDQVANGLAAYNIGWVLTTAAGFNRKALGAALDAFVGRHEALRTTFTSRNGANVQTLQEAAPVPLPARAVSPDQLEEVLTQLAAQPMDLARGPLFRAELLLTGGSEEHLAIVVHHIVFDGWSIDVMARELCSFYNRFTGGVEAPLPALPVQYADFASWQREWLADGALDTQLAYWTRKLRGAPAALAMPTDKARPPIPSYRGNHIAFSVPEETTVALRELARRHDATLYMVLLTALASVLGRWSGQEDVVIGTPVAGRGHVWLENLAGFFANTLAMRVEMADAGDFAALLARVRETAIEAYAHQDVPFSSLVEALNPVRDMSRQPIFQVMFALHPAPVDVSRLNPAFTAREVQTPTAKFDLALELFDTGAELRGALEFADDLWLGETMERLLGHLRTFLDAVARSPDGTRLPSMLAPEERASLMALSRGSDEPYPGDETITSIFERQAGATPDALAVFFESEELSYGAFNRRANQLARHLRHLGVGPGVVVGLCITRSAEMMVALIAILKAGAAYLPIDPAYPEDRIRFMLDDARVPVIVTDTALMERLRDSGQAVVCVDAADARLAAYDDANPGGGAGPDDVAYLIYTSGSTGRPKGVLIPHRAILNHLTWMQRFHSLDGTDRVLQNATISFDVSVWQLFWPLMNGAAVVVTAPGGHRDMAYVIDLVERAGVTVMHMVPSMLQVLVDTVPPQRLRNVRDFIVGGEALGAELQNRFIERFRARLHNQYGPTETSVEVTHHRCVLRPASSPVPIGRPIMNTQVYILDRDGELCPVGVYGELFIAGAGVGNGYLNRDALNLERFVANPFAPGRRMYRTGDLCRWISSGEIEFAGRLDHQVKLNGLRIETGEIDAVCCELPAVRQAVTIVRNDPGRPARLVSYVVGGEVDEDAVITHARVRLPAFMVPAAVVVLDAFPLTPNGKVDRNALPAPRDAGGRTRVAPSTPTEAHVVAAVESLIGSPVSTRDDFFAVGGHSLLAIRLVSRLADALGASIPVKAVFDHPRFDALAAAIDGGSAGLLSMPDIPAVPRTGDLPLSLSQEALWLFEQMETGLPVYNVPWTLHMSGQVDVGALELALSRIVERHESLRTVFVFEGDGPVQRVMPVRPVTLTPEAVDQAGLSSVLTKEAAVLFDLEAGPLYRFRLLRTSPTDYCLSIVLHHIVSDGWSVDILARELCALYDAHVRNAPAALAPLPRQYGDFAVWQRERIGSGALDAQLDYWRKRLAGPPASLDLPTDRPRPRAPTHRGSHVAFVVSPALTAAVRALARQEGATLYMVVLAAFASIIGRRAHSDDVVIGSPIAGRGHPACEDLIGFFVNTLPMRIDLTGAPAPTVLIHRARETAVEAFANQDVPFARMVKLVGASRTGGTLPLVQVMLALYTPDAAPVIPGLSLAAREGGTDTTKFDLNMEISERSEQLEVRLEYASDLWDPATVQALSQEFITWLSDATRTVRNAKHTDETAPIHLARNES